MKHHFIESNYFLTEIPRFPKIKLRGISATLSVVRMEQELIMDVDDLISFILRKVVSGKERLFDENHQPLDKPEGMQGLDMIIETNGE